MSSLGLESEAFGDKRCVFSWSIIDLVRTKWVAPICKEWVELLADPAKET
jgi:hypothetical protein